MLRGLTIVVTACCGVDFSLGIDSSELLLSGNDPSDLATDDSESELCFAIESKLEIGDSDGTGLSDEIPDGTVIPAYFNFCLGFSDVSGSFLPTTNVVAFISDGVLLSDEIELSDVIDSSEDD